MPRKYRNKILVPIVSNRDLIAVFSRRKVQKLLRKLSLRIPVIVVNRVQRSKWFRKAKFVCLFWKCICMLFFISRTPEGVNWPGLPFRGWNPELGFWWEHFCQHTDRDHQTAIFVWEIRSWAISRGACNLPWLFATRRLWRCSGSLVEMANAQVVMSKLGKKPSALPSNNGGEAGPSGGK